MEKNPQSRSAARAQPPYAAMAPVSRVNLPQPVPRTASPAPTVRLLTATDPVNAGISHGSAMATAMARLRRMMPTYAATSSMAATAPKKSANSKRSAPNMPPHPDSRVGWFHRETIHRQGVSRSRPTRRGTASGPRRRPCRCRRDRSPHPTCPRRPGAE